MRSMRGEGQHQEAMFSYVRMEQRYQAIIRSGRFGRWWMNRCVRWRMTLGADKSYQEEDFVGGLRSEQVVPHVAEYAPNPKWANWLTDSERNDAGFSISQRKRKLVEKVFGWMKQGRLRQVKVRGLRRVD
jgi:hypothetical protein